jgi:signal peptidase I
VSLSVPPDLTDPESPAVDAGSPASAKSRSATRVVLEWAAIVALAVLGAFLIRAFVVQPFSIPSGSMEPTLKDHDRLLVNKLSYHSHPVHRGDVVVFKKPPDDITPGITDLVKRVIGLPGETISAHNGQVYIDGRYLRQPWLPKVDRGVTVFPSSIPGCLPSPPGSCRIPAGEYFMLGDNRTDSADSRFIGPVSRSLFIGRAFILVWPLSRIGFL